MVIKSDSLVGEPVFVHSFYDFDFDAILFSPRESHPPKLQDVLDVFDNIRSPFLSYMTISLLLATIMLTMSRLGVRKVIRKSKCIMRTFGFTLSNTSCHVIYATVNRFQIEFHGTSSRYLWMSIVTCLFISITGYLWSFLSTDQVVEIPARQVDFIDDLFEVFGNRYFTLTTNFFIYETLATAPPGSKLWKLYKRLNDTYTMDWNQGGEVAQSFGSHRKIKATSASWRWLFDNPFVTIFCHVDAHEIEVLHLSAEKFAPGLMTSMFSRDIDQDLREYVSYRLLTRTEMGLPSPTVEKVVLEGLHGFSFETNWKAYRCMHGLRDEPEQAIPLLRLTGLRTTFGIVKWCFLVATCVLIFEPVVSASGTWL